VALSWSSWFGSTLTTLAIYLLGAAVASRAVGLVAAAGWAMEFEAIDWSVDGWRDDTFTLWVTLSALALVRARQQPTGRRAAMAGLACAGACLTRLSAVTFVAPSMAWLAIASPEGSPIRRLRAPLIAALTAAACVSPYVVNCWIETGDPFYAVNYHTIYYRSHDELPGKPADTALSYLGGKIASRPLQAFDTGLQGLLTYPLFNKFRGFDEWWGPLPRWLRLTAILGLVLFLWLPDGRLLLVLVFSSLAPYALTWSVGAGGEWRFTQHAYPIFLVAAAYALDRIARAALACRRPAQALGRTRRWILSRQGVAIGSGVALIAAWYVLMPAYLAAETLAHGEPAMIEAGPRDRVFFAGPWSRPSPTSLQVRVAQGEQSAIRLRLPEQGRYLLTLRMDPAETRDAAQQPGVAVFFNRQRLAALTLQRTPGRMGAYRFVLEPSMTRRGWNRIDLVATHTVPAARAGRPFRWLPRRDPVAFQLWYVRLEPLPE